MQRITWKGIAIGIAVALVLAIGLTFADAHNVLGAAVSLAYIAPAVVAKKFDDLNYLANPVEAGQGEAISSILYDTQTFTSAATTQLT